MTITTAPVRQSFDGNGSVTAFAIPWKYFVKSDVVVTLRDSSDVEALQVITTHYTLSAAGISTGGTCTMVTAPASGETLVITLDPPHTQASPLPLGGGFPSTTVENALDKLTQLTAKVEELLNRAMLVPKSDTQIGSNLELPIDADRASKFLSADANGKIIFAAGTSADLGPVSSYIDTLLDDADAVTARQTLLLDTSGADIASADTIDLDAATGDFVDVTGTTTITTITLGDGVEQTVRFTGSLTLTHGASLVLKGSANIQTAAGDVAVFRGDASSVVRLVHYYRLQRHGSDVASATTTDLDAATGDLIDVTGTTTITGITLGEGRKATVRFTGALILTNGASLILPGAANITTVAGDFAIFRGYASAVVRCVSYQRLEGVPSSIEHQTLVTASGTTVDFTGLPLWARRVTVMFNQLSTNGTTKLQLQLGGSGGIETTGYNGTIGDIKGTTDTTVQLSSGFDLNTVTAAAGLYSGQAILTLLDPANQTWTAQIIFSRDNVAEVSFAGGSTNLSTALQRVRVTAGGSDTFDNGTVQVRVEA